MTRTARQLLSEVLALPEDERIEIATELLASLDGPADSGWDEAWAAEIDRRLEAAKRGGEKGIEWSEARARILARLATE